MERMMRVLMCVVAVITCFDVVVWCGDYYMRKVGERWMVDSKAMSDTEKVLKEAAEGVETYIRNHKRPPRNLYEANVTKGDGWYRSLRLGKDSGTLVVVSAGADGIFGTDDDVVRLVGRCES